MSETNKEIEIIKKIKLDYYKLVKAKGKEAADKILKEIINSFE